MREPTQVINHLTLSELESGLDHVRHSPSDDGSLLMIVRRPAVEQREVLDKAEIDVEKGLVGDVWKSRGSRSTPDGRSNPKEQLTIINSRLIGLLAQSEERWRLAGDQLVIDLDLSTENLPPGAHVSIGEAVVEISDKPHTGCWKFAERFGKDALRFVSTPTAMQMRLRGVNTRVVESGTIRVGDVATKL